MTTLARPTLLDVARAAGVSVATVDRALNKRAGVHERTVGRVAEAVRSLRYRPDPAAARLARSRAHRVRFILPSGSNAFVASLSEQISANSPWMADHRVAAETVEVDVFEPEQVAAQLRAAAGACDAVVVMALDHPVVRAAIDEHWKTRASVVADAGCPTCRRPGGTISQSASTMSPPGAPRRRCWAGSPGPAADRLASSSAACRCATMPSATSASAR